MSSKYKVGSLKQEQSFDNNNLYLCFQPRFRISIKKIKCKIFLSFKNKSISLFSTKHFIGNREL